MPNGAVSVIQIEEQESESTSSTIEVAAHRAVGHASSLRFHTGLYKSLDDLNESVTNAATITSAHGRAANSILAAESCNTLGTLFAQHMFAFFTWAAAKTVSKPIDDSADIRPINSDSKGGPPSILQSFALFNTKLSKMAQDIQNTGLGSLEEVYLCIIPPLSKMNKLPPENAIIEWTREHATPHEQLGHWAKATDAYLWLFRTVKMLPEPGNIIFRVTALLMEHLRALAEATELKKAQQYPERDIGDLQWLQQQVEKELRDVSVEDTLAQLLCLYELQGRLWQCSFVSTLEILEDKREMLGLTDLHWEVCAQHLGIFSESEVDQESVGKKDILDWTPLHYAVLQSSDGVLQWLLSCCPNVNVRDICGRTPLHYACSYSNIQTVRFLLSAGAAIGIQDTFGMAPIHHAAINGQVPAMRLLIEAGTPINQADASGYTPLLWAACKGHHGVIKELRKYSDSRVRDRSLRTPLHLAAMAPEEYNGSREDVFKLLLEMDVDKDTQDMFGKTPLHVAAEAGHLDLVKLLFDRGADIKAEDSRGRTPLQVACEAKKGAVADFLSSHL